MPNPTAPTARLAIVALLVAACSGATPSSAPPTAPASLAPVPSVVATSAPTVEPTATPAPTATATPSAGPVLLESSWTLSEPHDVTAAAVHTGTGWVALSDGCGGGCDESHPTGLTSVDGLGWAAKEFESAGAWPLAIASNGGHVYGVGRLATGRLPDYKNEAVIWDSADGSSWKRLTTVDLGECGGTCLSVQTLAVNEDGVLVMGAGRSGEGGPSGVFRSDDGKSWTRVKWEAFGGAEGRVFEVVNTITVGKTFVLAGSSEDSGTGIWTSDDARTWTRVAAIDTLMPRALELDFDGNGLVLAAESCIPGGACLTTTWSGALAGPFSSSTTLSRLGVPRLAAVGGTFVLAGMIDGAPHVYASTDGSAWTEQATTLDFAGCDIASLVGGPDSLLLITDPDCAQTWIGRPAS
jgi:hypothetical protein